MNEGIVYLNTSTFVNEVSSTMEKSDIMKGGVTYVIICVLNVNIQFISFSGFHLSLLLLYHVETEVTQLLWSDNI